MSVLNQSGEEQVECPLCMEPLEVDDLNFFPCTCGYQICRFCWHRIRTDENGLCPACRKAYSEDPADFTPLSQEQVAKLKAEKRQKDQQRKAKLSESRKHLASVRVVQKNLVFVVGLPMRLADPEVLKRHEYFGKFGKIHKVVINQSTSYAGSQGPSASAYVTYMKSDDALRAIQSVNNITIDGRLIKSSLGTTKYCSHFMKNQPCPKPDCMYLHDFGDPEASFTKEQMHAGKHQEYEKKLHEALLQRSNNNNNNNNNSNNNNNNSTSQSTVTQGNSSTVSSAGSTVVTVTSTDAKATTKSKEAVTANGTNKENWPQLNSDKETKDKKTDGSKDKSKGKSKTAKEKKEKKSGGGVENTSTNQTNATQRTENKESRENSKNAKEGNGSVDKLTMLDDNSSFFSHNSFQKIVPENSREDDESPTQPPILTDSLPDINTTEDWAAAFGFNKLENLQNRTETSPSPIDSFFRTDDFRNLIETSKIQDNLRDALTNKTNGYKAPTQDSYFGKESGLDQHVSKLFMDFHQKNGQKDNGYNASPATHHNNVVNGFSSHLNNYIMNSDRLVFLPQKKLEEHLMNLSLKHQNSYGQMSHNNGQYMNGGDVGQQNGYGYQGSPFQNQQSQIAKSKTHSEDDLGFDPFQETQKALAELIANEQNYKTHNNVRGIPSGQINGIVHNQGNKNHVPPPPPGFVQPTTTHMNSFGSKILPFLNMSNNQQINNSTTTTTTTTSTSTQNWPSYNTQMQQHKNLGSNDWKDFDSAIVTTSRHYPLMPPLSSSFRSLQQQIGTQQIANGSLRSHDTYTNNAFSNFTQQLQQQPNFNSYSAHLSSTTTTTTQQQQQQPNLNWFTSELNSQISSPPGFRSTSQTSKQQEC